MTPETPAVDHDDEAGDGRIPLDLDSQLWEQLGLGIATSNVLERAGIRTVRQLVARTEVELLRLPQFGRTRLRNVKAALAEEGLSLATRSRFAGSERQALVEAHHQKVEEAARAQTAWRAVNKSATFAIKDAEDPGAVAVLTETVRRLRLDALRIAGALIVQARELDDLAGSVEPTAVARDVRDVAAILRELALSGEIAKRGAP